MEVASLIGTALGSSWASGVNLYATVLTLGLMHRFGGMELPGALDVCSNWWVIGVAAVMFCAEFVADKIPYVDSAWDLIHTFIRVPAGAVLAASTVSGSGTTAETIAFLVGGTVSLTAHGTKAATRATINSSPEPFSNIAVSTGEDGLVFALVGLVVFHPIVAGLLVLVILGLTIWLLPKILRLCWGLICRAKLVVFGPRREPKAGG